MADSFGFNDEILVYNNQFELYYVENYNPLNLPAYTIRLKYNEGVTPTFSHGGTGVQVSSSPNIWDLTYENSNWSSLLQYQPDLIEVLGANTSNVTNMGSLFYNSTALSNVAIFDTSNVTTTSMMFSKCAITTIPLFNFHNVTNAHSMFYDCPNLITIPLIDTSSVTNMYAMFYHCVNLESVPLLNTSNVTKMDSMFYICNKLETVPLFDTSKVTTMKGMFQQCANFKTAPLFNTSNVTDMSEMFYYCKKLTNVPLYNTSKVTNVNSMFNTCWLVESGALALYQQMASQTTPPASHTATFLECGKNTQTGAAELAQIPSDWKSW